MVPVNHIVVNILIVVDVTNWRFPVNHTHNEMDQMFREPHVGTNHVVMETGLRVDNRT
jgi:hypothetical protein